MNKICFLSNKYNIKIKEIEELSQYDPTQGKYLEWIIKSRKKDKLKFPEDGIKTLETLKLFHNKKQVLKNNGINTDIFNYSYGDLIQLLEQYSNTKGIRETVRANEIEGSKLILDKPPYKVFHITTPEAASKMCRDTEWCIKDPKHFENYKDAKIYLVFKNNKRYALIDEQGNQFKDVYDRKLKDDKLIMFLFNNSLLKEPVGGDFGYRLLYKLNKEVLNSPKLSYYYALIIKKRFSEAEPIIMKDSFWAYSYAYDIIKDRWIEAEPVIMKNPQAALFYSLQVIKNRWPEAEPYIKQDPQYAYFYALNLKGSWPEAEPYIKQNSQWAYVYARDVKGRFPEAEPVIMKDHKYAYDYAYSLIQGRWTEAEPYIMKYPFDAYRYAYYIIKDRWFEAEPVIMKDPRSALFYAIDVLKKRWPEAEPYIKGSQYEEEYNKNFKINLLSKTLLKFLERC